MEKQIVLNRRKCTKCGDVITSYTVHDYVTCSCGRASVDGGSHYERYTEDKEYPSISLSVYSDAPFEVLRVSAHRGGRGKDGDQPLTWTPICDMNDEWLEACVDYNEQRGMSDDFNTNLYREEIKYRKQMGITMERTNDLNHNLYNYLFWYNTYQGVWNAIPTDKQMAFFGGNHDVDGVIKNEDINYLIGLVNGK